MKTTEDIYDDCEQFEINNLREFSNPKDRLNFYNKQWFSQEEIRIAISEVKQWEHHDLSKDWEIELTNKLFNTPDLNSKSSDEDSLNKGYEVNQKCPNFI